jgi:hypothetical protein
MDLQLTHRDPMAYTVPEDDTGGGWDARSRAPLVEPDVRFWTATPSRDTLECN